MHRLDRQMKLLRSDSEYSLYMSDYVRRNQRRLLLECAKAHKTFSQVFPGTNSTASTTEAERAKYSQHEGYLLYNIFSITAPNDAFYGLYLEVLEAIRRFAPEKRFYLQAWLNYQKCDEVLGWHSHSGYKYHGYIAIDPKNTTTEFERHEVRNKAGQIYIGDPSIRHRVISNSPFRGRRVTIGFDLIEPQDIRISNKGFIPVAL